MRRLAILAALLGGPAAAQGTPPVSSPALACAAALAGATDASAGVLVLSEEAVNAGFVLYLQVPGQPAAWECLVDVDGTQVNALAFLGGEGG